MVDEKMTSAELPLEEILSGDCVDGRFVGQMTCCMLLIFH